MLTLIDGGILAYKVEVSISSLEFLLILLGRNVGIPTSMLTQDLIHKHLERQGNVAIQ